MSSPVGTARRVSATLEEATCDLMDDRTTNYDP